MENEINSTVVTPGSYVIVQKQNFRKICKVSEAGTFTFSKQQIESKHFIGKPYWTTFKILQAKKGKKTIGLEVAEVETSENLRQGVESGLDNRSITDDGTSQKLSKEAIEDLREAGKSSKEIVGCLIKNSSSFAFKTEYAQEKYIKKKEKKYFRFVTIHKPTISAIQEIYFRQDYSKINCLRMDTIGQILSYCNVQACGNYLLYDSGSCGLPAAALLNRIGAQTDGKLIHLHPGNQAQLTLVQAMNFPQEQLKRMHTVNLYTFLRIYHQGVDDILEELAKKHADHILRVAENLKRKNNDDIDNETTAKRTKLNDNNDDDVDDDKCTVNNELIQTVEQQIDKINLTNTFKHPRWFTETKEAVSCINDYKAHGLAIIAKEHPFEIVKALLPFLGISRPFVIYHYYREPLQETYIALKQRKDIINLKLFSNFCRGYQVMSNRTHPEILTNDLGGYLLTGYLVEGYENNAL